MVYGILEEHEVHGDDARLHIVVLQLLLHELLQVLELHNVIVDDLILFHEVTCKKQDCQIGHGCMHVMHAVQAKHLHLSQHLI